VLSTLALRSDIKPENLLCSIVDGLEVVKLADFGSAVQLDHTGTASVDPVAQGTTLYSPPEVLNGLSYSCAADIWAAGITAYVLISGYFPFGCAADALSSHPSFDGEGWLPVSVRARDFILDLLQHDPAFRPSAQEALLLPWLRYRAARPPMMAGYVATSSILAVAPSYSAPAPAAEPQQACSSSPRAAPPAAIKVPTLDSSTSQGSSTTAGLGSPEPLESPKAYGKATTTCSPAAPPSHTPYKKRPHTHRDKGSSPYGSAAPSSSSSSHSEVTRWPAKKRLRRNGSSSKLMVVATVSEPVVESVPLQRLVNVLWHQV
jgi:serine/threonine protein kinase